MAIHLVGETIDARQAHQRAQAGELIQLVRGIYVESDGDADAVILGHAVRIARHLYPSAYLSSASAILLGPTPDGRLFISGRRNHRVRLRALEIIQNEAPPHPSTTDAVVGDDLGELRVAASSLRQRLLEAFRLRSEYASAMTAEMRSRLAARLVAEHGSPQAAADAVWALARENGWWREGERAERFLLAPPGAAARAPVNKAAIDLLVAWHGEPLGRLIHDGFEWRWKPRKSSGPPLVRETAPGKLPAFIASLLPEGWLAQVLRERDEREALRRGRRYLSNIAIVPDRKALEATPADILLTPLEAFQEAGRFTGRYAGPGRGEIEETEQNLALLFARPETPRLSGVQIKAPMSLRPDGVLAPAVDLPFTHILKPAGAAGFETLPVVEWLCLELGRAAGFDVPSAALIEMPDGAPPALVVERFDIRRDAGDRRRLALEDFCSILDLPTAAKYDGTIERMARALRPLSTDPAADLDILFRRAIFAWLIADGDMHLKNLAVLKTADIGAKTFASVRFAPLYDAVTTRVFPGLAGDRMALKLNGKDDRLGRQDFLALARTIGLTANAAEAALTELATRLSERSATFRLPDFAGRQKAAGVAQARVAAIVGERTGPFRR